MDKVIISSIVTCETCDARDLKLSILEYNIEFGRIATLFYQFEQELFSNRKNWCQDPLTVLLSYEIILLAVEDNLFGTVWEKPLGKKPDETP